jgi:hypothetical protein
VSHEPGGCYDAVPERELRHRQPEAAPGSAPTSLRPRTARTSSTRTLGRLPPTAPAGPKTKRTRRPRLTGCGDAQAAAAWKLIPTVLTAVSRLLEPDDPGGSDQVEHRLTQLFGVPLVAVPLEPGEWRLVTADGTVLDRAGIPSQQKAVFQVPASANGYWSPVRFPTCSTLAFASLATTI